MEAGEPKVGKGKISAARALPPKTSAQRQIANIFFMASLPAQTLRLRLFPYFMLSFAGLRHCTLPALYAHAIRHQVFPHYKFPSFVVRHFPIKHFRHSSSGTFLLHAYIFIMRQPEEQQQRNYRSQCQNRGISRRITEITADNFRINGDR